jgi:hypothetical protein
MGVLQPATFKSARMATDQLIALFVMTVPSEYLVVVV